MIPSAVEQLHFLHKIQLLLDEGKFSSTYKYSLLLALADLSVEQGDDLDSTLALSIDDISKKFISYYWPQAKPYPSHDSPHETLIQNRGKQAAIISKITKRQDITHVVKATKDKKLVTAVKKDVQTMPLWKLQQLPGRVDDFLYEQNEDVSNITLRAGVAYCFRVFHRQISTMVQGSWVNWIRTYQKNNSILGQHTDLSEFLFGTERATLTKYVPVLKQLQSNTCFYCKKNISSDKGEVDHFIPWSRYSVDLGHNFVLAHGSCNKDKRDMLAGVIHLERWFERNQKHETMLNDYFEYNNLNHDLTSSLSISTWAYEKVEAMQGDVWLASKGQTEKLNASWRNILSP